MIASMWIVSVVGLLFDYRKRCKSAIAILAVRLGGHYGMQSNGELMMLIRSSATSACACCSAEESYDIKHSRAAMAIEQSFL